MLFTFKFPKSPSQLNTSGSIDFGISKSSNNSLSHSRVCMLKSIVRDAFVTSVNDFDVQLICNQEGVDCAK